MVESLSLVDLLHLEFSHLLLEFHLVLLQLDSLILLSVLVVQEFFFCLDVVLFLLLLDVLSSLLLIELGVQSSSHVAASFQFLVSLKFLLLLVEVGVVTVDGSPLVLLGE